MTGPESVAAHAPGAVSRISSNLCPLGRAECPAGRKPAGAELVRELAKAESALAGQSDRGVAEQLAARLDLGADLALEDVGLRELLIQAVERLSRSDGGPLIFVSTPEE